MSKRNRPSRRRSIIKRGKIKPVSKFWKRCMKIGRERAAQLKWE